MEQHTIVKRIEINAWLARQHEEGDIVNSPVVIHIPTQVKPTHIYQIATEATATIVIQPKFSKNDVITSQASSLHLGSKNNISKR